MAEKQRDMVLVGTTGIGQGGSVEVERARAVRAGHIGDDPYETNSWSGIPNYQCLYCEHATLWEVGAWRHYRRTHLQGPATHRVVPRDSDAGKAALRAQREQAKAEKDAATPS